MQFRAITLSDIPEASYLTAANASRYRAIMWIFYLESQKANIRLNKQQLMALLRSDSHFAQYTAEELEQQEEPSPPRSKAVQQTRNPLKERGIW